MQRTASGGSGTASYLVGGWISGLNNGSSVVLQDNGGDNLTVSGNVTFTFATPIVNGNTYSVAVLTQPTGQTCTVSNGTGTVSGNVTNVSVACANNNPVPTVSILSPCGGVANGVPFTLTINGSNFVSGATTTFNGTAVTTTFVSSSSISASIPSTLIATAPSGNVATVIVTNPSPGGGASNTAYFGVASKVASLSANVQSIFTTSCATSLCHVAGRAAPDLSNGTAYASLVGVPSTGCSPTLLVLTCGPMRSQSVLVDKIQATNVSPACGTGSPMPKGSPALTNTQIQTIVDWVAEGAPNN